MDRIANNPYRILGVYSNAAIEEIALNKLKLIDGSVLSFEMDTCSLLPPVNRTNESVEKAFSCLSSPSDRLKYAMFWFAKETMIDELALVYLKHGDKSKAIETWGRIESWSSLVNLSVLEMINDNFGSAMDYMGRIIHNDGHRTDMVNAICGSSYSIEESELLSIYLDNIKNKGQSNCLYVASSSENKDSNKSNESIVLPSEFDEIEDDGAYDDSTSENSKNRLCYYCGKNETDIDSMYEKEMYKVTGRSGYTGWQYRTKTVYYDKTVVLIDRCKRCKRIHAVTIAISILLTLATIIGLITWLGWAFVVVWLLISPLVYFLFVFIFSLLFRIVFRVKGRNNVLKDPDVNELREHGWTLIQPIAR